MPDKIRPSPVPPLSSEIDFQFVRDETSPKSIDSLALQYIQAAHDKELKSQKDILKQFKECNYTRAEIRDALKEGIEDEEILSDASDASKKKILESFDPLYDKTHKLPATGGPIEHLKRGEFKTWLKSAAKIYAISFLYLSGAIGLAGVGVVFPPLLILSGVLAVASVADFAASYYGIHAPKKEKKEELHRQFEKNIQRLQEASKKAEMIKSKIAELEEVSPHYPELKTFKEELNKIEDDIAKWTAKNNLDKLQKAKKEKRKQLAKEREKLNGDIKGLDNRLNSLDAKIKNTSALKPSISVSGSRADEDDDSENDDQSSLPQPTPLNPSKSSSSTPPSVSDEELPESGLDDLPILGQLGDSPVPSDDDRSNTPLPGTQVGSSAKKLASQVETDDESLELDLFFGIDSEEDSSVAFYPSSRNTDDPNSSEELRRAETLETIVNSFSPTMSYEELSETVIKPPSRDPVSSPHTILTEDLHQKVIREPIFDSVSQTMSYEEISNTATKPPPRDPVSSPHTTLTEDLQQTEILEPIFDSVSQTMSYEEISNTATKPPPRDPISSPHTTLTEEPESIEDPEWLSDLERENTSPHPLHDSGLATLNQEKMAQLMEFSKLVSERTNEIRLMREKELLAKAAQSIDEIEFEIFRLAKDLNLNSEELKQLKAISRAFTKQFDRLFNQSYRYGQIEETLNFFDSKNSVTVSLSLRNYVIRLSLEKWNQEISSLPIDLKAKKKLAGLIKIGRRLQTVCPSESQAEIGAIIELKKIEFNDLVRKHEQAKELEKKAAKTEFMTQIHQISDSISAISDRDYRDLLNEMLEEVKKPGTNTETVNIRREIQGRKSRFESRLKENNNPIEAQNEIENCERILSILDQMEALQTQQKAPLQSAIPAKNSDNPLSANDNDEKSLRRYENRLDMIKNDFNGMKDDPVSLSIQSRLVRFQLDKLTEDILKVPENEMGPSREAILHSIEEFRNSL